MARKSEAVKLLVLDHETVRSLLEELAETTPRGVKKRRELLEQVGAELRAHARIEEEIFYPALLEATTTQEQEKLLHEAREEHRAVEDLVLPDLEDTDLGSVQFGGRAKVLKELVEHHADEEQEDMFPLAEELLSKDELDELGERMRARKEELLAERAG